MTRHAVAMWLLCSLVGAAATTSVGGATSPSPAVSRVDGGRLANAAAPRREAARELRVFAAASLHDAFLPLGELLERRHPGTRVRFNFEGSQQLASQLEQGATADVLAAADERWMEQVREHGLLMDPSVVFAHNRLVVVVPKADPGHIETLRDLARAGVKLVLGADAVPVGRYARIALNGLADVPGFPTAYAVRVLRNVVSEEENVKSVLGKVRLGEADAGVVYASDVTPEAAGELRVLDFPESANVVASYPIAVLAGSRSAPLAREFVELVRSPEGRQALQRAGFRVPAADDPR